MTKYLLAKADKAKIGNYVIKSGHRIGLGYLFCIFWFIGTFNPVSSFDGIEQLIPKNFHDNSCIHTIRPNTMPSAVAHMWTKKRTMYSNTCNCLSILRTCITRFQTNNKPYYIVKESHALFGN